ncbi:hypothetical protein WMF38_23185 [Sorangium sp. So ce118]
MKSLFLMITVAMSATALGCVEGEAYKSELADDELGQTQQAIGDVGCGTISMSGMDAADGISRSTLGVQQSPDWTYNPGPTCPYQYLVEYTNLPAGEALYNLYIRTRLHDDTVFADITNETDCERTHLLTGYYVWNTSSSSPTITTLEEHGNWSGTGCNTTVVGALPALDGKYKVRVAARALYCAFSDGCTEAQRTNLKVETSSSWDAVIQ